MPIMLFFAIPVIVACATLVLLHIEWLALQREICQHRKIAMWFLVGLTILVFALEALLYTETVRITAPTWLYYFHLAVAGKSYLILAAKAVTARRRNLSLHAWLSKPLWIFWWPAMGSAVLIGAWNLAAA